MEKQELARLLMSASYLEGDFALRSGRRSHYIIDKYAFETDPELLQAISEELAAMLPEDTDRLAGVELGGVPLATALALRTGIPFVIVKKAQKGYGTDKLIEGGSVAGSKVVLVEDVATTAGSATAAAGALKDAGAAEVTVLLVVDRQEGAAQAFEAAGIPYRALFTRDSLGIEADK